MPIVCINADGTKQAISVISVGQSYKVSEQSPGVVLIGGNKDKLAVTRTREWTNQNVATHHKVTLTRDVTKIVERSRPVTVWDRFVSRNRPVTVTKTRSVTKDVTKGRWVTEILTRYPAGEHTVTNHYKTTVATRPITRVFKDETTRRPKVTCFTNYYATVTVTR